MTQSSRSKSAKKGWATRRKNEKRGHTLSDPDDFLREVFLGAGTDSGKRVTAESALTYSGVYAAIKVISEGIAALPLRVQTIDSEGNTQPAVNHPLWRVLRTVPNPEQTAMEFYEQIACDLLIRGNYFAVVERDGGGRVAQIWRLRPERVRIERKDGALIYRFVSSHINLEFRRDEIIHIRNLTKDGIIGLSPIDLHREAIGLGLAAQEYAAKLYSNGAQPSGILSTDNRLSPEGTKNLQKQWNKFHQGSGNAHRVAVLTDGMKFQATSFSPQDTDFIAQRKFQITEIARIYRVPPHMIGDLERATFTNIEQQSLEFVRDTLRPWLVRIEQALERDLMSEAERAVLKITFNVDAILRADIETRFKSYSTGFMNSVFTTNEIRRIEGLNSIGEEGDVHYRPIQLVPLDSPPATNNSEGQQRSVESESTAEPAPTTEPVSEITDLLEKRAQLKALAPSLLRHELAKAHRPMFVGVAQRILAVEAANVREILSQVDDMDIALTRLEKFYTTDHRDVVKNMIQGAAQEYGKVIAEEALKEVGFEESNDFDVDAFAALYATKAAVRWTNNSMRQILKLVIDNPDDPRPGVFARLENWESDRPDKFALRETVQENGAVSREAFKSIGVASLKWKSLGDTAATELDGQIASINGGFVQKGDQIGDVTANTKIHHPPLAEGDESIILPVIGFEG